LKTDSTIPDTPPEGAWYRHVTRYQWLVLVIASLGWIFDIFEGQIFVATMKEAMPSLLPEGSPEGLAEKYNDYAFAMFLIGGAFGGVFFGVLSDRIGRAKTLMITILVYSLFGSLTAFATAPWQVITLRFFVALGIGGEWAVASALVAEVFPKFARVKSLGIFHATSTIGSYLAIAAGYFIVANEGLRNHSIDGLNWRLCFLLGALPALLTIWIRFQLKEPEAWKKAHELAKTDRSQRTGRVVDLFSPQLIRGTLTGLCLAGIGLATFWGVKVRSQDLMRDSYQRELMSDVSTWADAPAGAIEKRLAAHKSELKRAEMTGLFLIMTGGFIGMLCFGPLSLRWGRRGAFLFFHAGGFLVSVLLFTVLAVRTQLFYWLYLPVFGFLVSGMHAGYAVYFPELFPARLRSTGASFCFNAGRLIAAPALILRGFMMDDLSWDYTRTNAVLSSLFLLGFVVLLFAPETNDKELME
jgi:MFS family permease